MISFSYLYQRQIEINKNREHGTWCGNKHEIPRRENFPVEAQRLSIESGWNSSRMLLWVVTIAYVIRI